MKRITIIAVAAISGLLLASCATQIKSEVTRFHVLAAPSGEIIQIVHRDPEKNSSPEFHAYAQMIGERMGSLGYRPTPPGGVPDIVVELDYGVGPGPAPGDDSGRTRGTVGVGVGSHGGGVNVGLSGIFGAGSRGAQTHLRRLELEMIRASDHDVLFEGRVVSLGRNGSLAEIMPYLIAAMFDGFPGESGKTNIVIADVPLK